MDLRGLLRMDCQPTTGEAFFHQRRAALALYRCAILCDNRYMLTGGSNWGLTAADAVTTAYAPDTVIDWLLLRHEPRWTALKARRVDDAKGI